MINKDTIVRLLTDCPLDNTYRNTIYFSSASMQTSYFSALTKYVFTDLSFQRTQKVLRIEKKADSLYDCNYIMFQNTAFGSKWFYAFITDVQYINDNMSEITFEIDVMQTWHFDYELMPCFVEREHSATDNIGDNLVPENLELGEYVCRDFDGTNGMSEMRIVIAATFDGSLEPAVGGKYGGMYSGLYYNVFSTADAANAFIEAATAANKSDGIVSVFMMPYYFIGEKGSSVKSYTITKTKSLSDIDGYTPRNKKLFTHPFNLLYVTNLCGNFAEFRYEFFKTESGGETSYCQFGLTGDMSCNPQIILYPKNYKGLPANYNEKMVMDGYPQCAYSTDAFKAWLAQNAASIGVSLGLAVGGAIVNPLSLVATVPSVANKVAQAVQHATMPRQAHGTAGNSALVALTLKDFAFIRMSITAQFARIIDEYFDVYGYATHRVKIPNRTARAIWNYVKTINSNIKGSIPAPDLAKIRSIYDSGITFWKTGATLGRYDLTNNIL